MAKPTATKTTISTQVPKWFAQRIKDHIEHSDDYRSISDFVRTACNRLIEQEQAKWELEAQIKGTTTLEKVS